MTTIKLYTYFIGIDVSKAELDFAVMHGNEFMFHKEIANVITALYILITTNEFRNINCPKKFACYCGVAPFPRESGKSVAPYRISSIANKKMKSLLHTSAMSCISHNGELRDYYKRKTVLDGKPKMAVLNAVRFKLILRVFACVNQNRAYEKSFTTSKPVVAL